MYNWRKQKPQAKQPMLHCYNHDATQCEMLQVHRTQASPPWQHHPQHHLPPQHQHHQDLNQLKSVLHAALDIEHTCSSFVMQSIWLHFGTNLDLHGALSSRMDGDVALQLLDQIITKGFGGQAMCKHDTLHMQALGSPCTRSKFSMEAMVELMLVATFVCCITFGSPPVSMEAAPATAFSFRYSTNW